MEFKSTNLLKKMTSRQLQEYILESLQHCHPLELLEIAEKSNDVLERILNEWR